MRKLFFGGLMLLSSVAMAQPISGWKITDVRTKGNNSVVGYIMYNNAIGTQKGTTDKKVTSSLRLVCSGKNSDETKDPVIVLFWESMQGNIPQTINITADNKKVPVSPSMWTQDGQALIRSVSDSSTLIQSMKVSNLVKFQWSDHNYTSKTVIFSMKDFNLKLDEFNKFCKTNI